MLSALADKTKHSDPDVESDCGRQEAPYTLWRVNGKDSCDLQLLHLSLVKTVLRGFNDLNAQLDTCP